MALHGEREIHIKAMALHGEREIHIKAMALHEGLHIHFDTEPLKKKKVVLHRVST